jgi:hypothetical protein
MKVIPAGIVEARNTLQAHFANDLLVHRRGLRASHTLDGQLVCHLNKASLIHTKGLQKTRASKESNEGRVGTLLRLFINAVHGHSDRIGA